MAKLRVYELAKELEVPSRRIIDLLHNIGFTVKNHMSVVSEEAAAKIRYQLTGKGEPPEAYKDLLREKEKKEDKVRDAGGLPKEKAKRKKTEKKKAERRVKQPPAESLKKEAADKPKKPIKKPAPERKKRGDKKERRAVREARKVSERKRRENTIVLESRVTVAELAAKLNISAAELISKLISLGVMVSINQAVETDLAKMIAEDYGYEVELK